MIEYRNANLEEVRLVLDMAAEEGWNPGLDDAAAFYVADSQGFFVATDTDGPPVAAISVVNHGPDFAFLGLYIVSAAYRGKGIGFGLWKHAIEHAGDRTIGLDGVEAQQANYRASGFVYAGGTTRFTGPVTGQRAPEIRRTNENDVATLIKMEAAASSVAKPVYLTEWFSETAHRVTIVYQEGDAVSGFCTIRACRRGAKIGPLIAENATIAHRLIAHAASIFEGCITLDVPETSTELTGLCNQLQLEAGFKTARMYRGNSLESGHANYAVATLELG